MRAFERVQKPVPASFAAIHTAVTRQVAMRCFDRSSGVGGASWVLVPPIACVQAWHTLLLVLWERGRGAVRG